MCYKIDRSLRACAEAAYLAAAISWGRAYEHGRGNYFDDKETLWETAKGLGIADNTPFEMEN